MRNKAAVIQMTSSMDVTKNLQQAEHYITEAARQEAQLVVLPEMWATMTMSLTDKITVAESFGAGPIQDFMAQQAQQHNIWIVGGTIPIISAESDKIRAASLVYDDAGEVVGRYDKIHLFDVTISASQEEYCESSVTEPGDEVIILDTPIGRLGVAVCYDIRFPELFRVMFKHGVEIFAIPSAFTVPTGEAHWEILSRARAIENFSYVLAACQVGEHDAGRSTFGGSCIINPWGEVLQTMDAHPGVVTAEIDLAMQQEIRHSMPVLEHRKITEI